MSERKLQNRTSKQLCKQEKKESEQQNPLSHKTPQLRQE